MRCACTAKAPAMGAASGRFITCRYLHSCSPAPVQGLLREANQLEARHCRAHALCARCHSGGLLGPVLCENGECEVLYARLGAQTRLAALLPSMERMLCTDW